MTSFWCWVCGGASVRGMSLAKWMGTNFTGQSRARCPSSTAVCEACVSVMAGRPPNTERMWSHLVEGASHVRVNKGSKPAMRAFLRRSHASSWFAAIADTGQKHIVPWCPVNAPNQTGGQVLFEESLVILPSSEDGWRLMDDITTALTAGATKEEIGRGDYGSRAWQLLGHEALRALEGSLATHRGGSWFELALWLAQRDEEQVQARMTLEKETKRGRTSKGKGKNADSGGAARAAISVPPNSGVQRAEALGSAARSDARVGTVDGDAGRVAHHDDKNAESGGSAGRQLAFFP